MTEWNSEFEDIHVHKTPTTKVNKISVPITSVHRISNKIMLYMLDFIVWTR